MGEKVYSNLTDENMDTLIDTLSLQLKLLENHEMYEVCEIHKKLIDSIKTKDVETYIDIMFDIEGLKKDGFLKHEDTTTDIESKLLKFFDLKNIFHYSLIIQRIIPQHNFKI